MTPIVARETLVRALRVDLVGPDDDDPCDTELRSEQLRVRPARAYLTGFLVPATAAAARADEARDDERDALDDETATEQLAPSPDEADEETEGGIAQRPRFPSSFGLSVIVAPGETRLFARVTYGTYERITVPQGPADTTAGEQEGTEKRERTFWKRTPHRHDDIAIGLDLPARQIEIPDSDGLFLSVVTREVSDAERTLLDEGARTVTLFLVNRKDPTKAGGVEGATIFQARLALCSIQGFLPRPNPRGTRETDPEDERVADLLYRDTYEVAVGHGIAIEPVEEGHGANVFVQEVKTSWMPRAEVERTVHVPEIEGVELSMERIADLPEGDVEAMRRALLPLVPAYEAWIEQQKEQAIASLDEPRFARAREARKRIAQILLNRAREAATRIRGGIDRLCRDDLARKAFLLANRAMALQMWQRDGERLRAEQKVPTWRPFQLAFLLLALSGIADPESDEREIVDLIFFPTGGGKTEAYLGLSAFTLLLRRLRSPDATSGGVSVLMRYTLRLLTLDQLGRAATLICALETLRRKRPDELGKIRFSIGLWVGRDATPNRFGNEHGKDPSSAIARVLAFKAGRGPMFFPLDRCPWCGSPFVQDTFEIKPNRTAPRHLRVLCFGSKCPFRWSREHPEGIPVVVVDEEIYSELPPFLIATVDKLASLPWVYRTAHLFGKHITHYEPDYGYLGGVVPEAILAEKLRAPLAPPDLVLQDELHLIAGPLGSMVGLYETAIGHLSERKQDGRTIRPKIVASTATVRRAEAQIRALFCRSEVRIFPPPGPDRTTTFFAEVRSKKREHSRSYLGISAPGRSQKALLMRVYTSLLAASARLFRDAPEAADPYMTLIGYFNSLRELGGSRRIVEDEVRARLGRAGQARRLEEDPLFADRRHLHVVEITSRLSTSEVRDAYADLRLIHEAKDETRKRGREPKKSVRPVDVALATNMISVGLDVSRLGLMVVCGQPKTTAEYIQATSRVGRDPNRPGLVVALLNAYRARDRSHLEHFRAYHASFYRAVEATSVTPFAPRAVDRGLAALTVALARLEDKRLLHQDDARKIAEARADLGFVADVLVARAKAHADAGAPVADAVLTDLRARVEGLLDAWSRVAQDDPASVGLAYQQYEPPQSAKRYLLHYPVDPDLKNLSADARKFVANRSLRDVEGVTSVYVVDLPSQEPLAPESAEADA